MAKRPKLPPDVSLETVKEMESLVAQGKLSERAMRRWMTPKEELLPLLDDPAQQAEVVKDLNEALNALAIAGRKRRQH